MTPERDTDNEGTDWVVEIVQWLFILTAPTAFFLALCLLANLVHY